ncbi:MAG: IMP dehydrogenase, partial [Candidatus Saccharimonadales bacterium]
MKIGSPALTFDDVLLMPGKTTFDRVDIDITSRLTRGISLKTPLVAAPMDTVTEYKLAIKLAQLGGIGIIHRNLTIADQAAEVGRVKVKKLLVGAAIGTSPGYLERLQALVAAKVDVVVIDTAHGYNHHLLDALAAIKKTFPKLQVIAGSIATADAAQALIDAGADGLRVGMGPGAICTTRIVSGMGVPQLSAIIEIAAIARKADVPLIADGGINYDGDIVKALAAGASTVMMGRLFAATEESPGEVVSLARDDVPHRFQSIINGAHDYRFKTYRGMGSLGAMERGKAIAAEDEFHGKSYKSTAKLVPEGVEGLVPCSGSVADMVGRMTESLRSGMF